MILRGFGRTLPLQNFRITYVFMDKKNKLKKNKLKFNLYWLYGGLFVLFLLFQYFNFSGLAQKKVDSSELEKLLQSGDVEKVKIRDRQYAEIFIKREALDKPNYESFKKSPFFSSNAPLYEYNIGDLRFFEEQLKNYNVKKSFENGSGIFGHLLDWLPFIFLIGIWLFFTRRMSGSSGGVGSQIFSIGKSKASLFDQNQKVKISFKDVAGLEGAKEEVQEIVDFLKTPEKYTALGGKIPKGALLVGPPGTGKTLLAKAVAGEAKVPFFSLSGSDFVEMFVGVGASRVRDLFKQAKQKSPSIIFIDEIDAIGRARGKNALTGGNDERENTLNQLLTEMDGFGTDTNVIVLAATNRSDILDGALMRAGRFDRQIFIDLPDLNERKAIFEVHMQPLQLSDKVDTDFLAQQTPGFSGADIANLCNESALMAARSDKSAVEHQDFLDAVDRIIGGLEKKNRPISKKEKKIIAYHEAGHATVSWMLEHAAPLVKVTIVPRGQSLGAAWYLPKERMIVQTEQMLDEMCATLAGRAAESIIFGKISTGALNDLEKVTKQARAIVSIYGLNKTIGNITYYDSTGQSEYSFSKPYSESTAQTIDQEIKRIIEEQYERAVEILKKYKTKLKELADLLLEKEVIFKDNLTKIFGPDPFEDKENVSQEKPSEKEKPEPKNVTQE